MATVTWNESFPRYGTHCASQRLHGTCLQGERGLLASHLLHLVEIAGLRGRVDGRSLQQRGRGQRQGIHDGGHPIRPGVGDESGPMQTYPSVELQNGCAGRGCNEENIGGDRRESIKYVRGNRKGVFNNNTGDLFRNILYNSVCCV